jgi:hypothetical protein
MRRLLPLLLALLFFTTSVFAKEIWLTASGTANNVFFSDARVFNPNDHEITVQAYYLPRGNVNNSAEAATTFTVAKRTQKILDDIVFNTLHRGDVGGIRFVCPDDFIVTERVYAVTTVCVPGASLPCSTGQFLQGVDVTQALKKGVIPQLKSNAKFRTNIGAANTTTSTAHVTWRLYDKNDAVVATKTEDLQPYGVLGPSNVTAYFGNDTADLTDAWVSFVSDQPILAYGSVVDNGSTDQTYIAALADSGTTVTDNNPPQQASKTVTVVARDFAFNIVVSADLRAGDIVKFIISRVSGSSEHGFQLYDPDGEPLININAPLPTTPVERIITIPKRGTYFIVCTNTSCGTGHTNMIGSIVVETADGPQPPGY